MKKPKRKTMGLWPNHDGKFGWKDRRVIYETLQRVKKLGGSTPASDVAALRALRDKLKVSAQRLQAMGK